MKFSDATGKTLLYVTSKVPTEPVSKKRDYSTNGCEREKYEICSHPYDCIWAVQISDSYNSQSRVTCAVGIKPYVKQSENIKEE